MKTCPANHPALPALFDPSVPDNPVLWAVFKGRNTGKALTDDPNHPSQCVVRTDAILTFASRGIGQAFLQEAIASFRQTSPVWLVWPATLSAQLPAPEGGQIAQRLEFYDPEPRSPLLADLRRQLPAGFEIHPIDRKLLERCEWRSDMEFYCGSLENFLANGMGFCLMHDDEIIVETYVSSFGELYAEIGAITREAYRGRGYAPIACAFLIEACEKRGYQAYWSCDADNSASIQMGRKLGFRHERAYQILEYGPVSGSRQKGEIS
jgi:RimJ/RimL family protein N-acetyltransferase